MLKNETSFIRPNSPTPAATVIIIAWIGTLLMSKFTILITQDIFSIHIEHMSWVWIGVGLLMFSLTFIWDTIKPLRGYFLIMTVVLSIATLLDAAIRESMAWKNFFLTLSPMQALLTERALVFIEAILVILLLLVIGQKPQSFFLAKGHPGAPAEGVNWLGGKKPASWRRFATFMTITLGTLFAFFMSTLIHPSSNSFSIILPLLPIVLLAAILNSFSEELMYRAAPLSQLLNVVGKTQSLLLTAVFFGFGHYYGGIPSGPFGFIQTGLLALFLGKAMIETKGIVVPWLIHFILDAIIYSFLAISAVSAGR